MLAGLRYFADNNLCQSGISITASGSVRYRWSRISPSVAQIPAIALTANPSKNQGDLSRPPNFYCQCYNHNNISRFISGVPDKDGILAVANIPAVASFPAFAGVSYVGV
jgi:hypothetical protein